MALPPTNVETPPVGASAFRRRLRPWLAFFALAVFLVAGWLGGRALWADARWKAAERALARYDFAEALGEFEGYLRIWPGSVPAHLGAARAARRGDRYESAEEHLAAAEKAGVTPETALENILARVQRGDLDGVERPLRGYLRDGHPEIVLIAEALARGYTVVFRLPDAEAALDTLIERTPDHPAAHFWRGGLRELGGRVSDALPDFRLAVRHDPHRQEYRLRLGQFLIKNARANEAWPHFQELLRLSPDDPAVLLGAARCTRSLDQPSRAMGHLDTLLRDHPDDAGGWAERGLVHGDQGEREAALRCLRKAFDLDPGTHSIGLALCAELQVQGHDREALALRKKLEELKKENGRLAELVHRLAQTPRNAPVRHEMGLICLQSNAKIAALRWFAGALQDDPDYQPTHRALADFYERKGDAVQAQVHRERAGPPGP